MSRTKLALLSPLLLGSLACAHCGDAARKDRTNVDAALTDAASAERDAAPGERDASARADAQAQDAGASGMDGSVDGGSDAALEPSVNDSGLPDASGDGAMPPPAHTFVYVGGYSNSDPLRVYEIERATHVLRPIAHDAGVGAQASYITPSTDGRTLYVANEDDANPGITVLRVDPKTGVPVRVDHETAITSPYVFSSLSPDGKYLLAASYNGGNVGVYPVKSDGTLEPRVDMRSFGGGAQSHSVRVHASRAVFVPNKGLDSVAQLKLDATGKLSAASPDAFPAQAQRGMFDGPRHIAFSRDAKLAFVILELGQTLFSLAVQDDGTLRELDKQPRLPANSGMPSDTGAHVLAHPRANFVYGSNRGTDTLVGFSYDAAGKLTLLGHVGSRGKTPRNFDIDPLGEFLVVANQSGTVAVFRIGQDGRLTESGNLVSGLASPAAVAIVVH
ncbi:MAG TPA: beta-propeller fold lactonase family protein [Polyangiales bacterium]